ncbi:MAG: hypothetical protein U9Q94_00985 [Candidatus Bipolaricaulota bacterium]|nr:hypothetical protein [Candidatus Bipolaricaulota bacterium]
MSHKLALGLIVLSFALLIGLAVMFAFPLRGAFVAALVTPLIESFRVLRWYIHRISQLVLWSVLVIAGAILTLRMLTRTFPLPRASKQRRYVLVRSETASELKRLTTMINRARRHPFARRRMASSLVPLSVHLIAQRERLPLREARERFESFSWCDDDAIPAYFNFRRQYYGVGKGRVFDERQHDIVAFLERYHQGV